MGGSGTSYGSSAVIYSGARWSLVVGGEVTGGETSDRRGTSQFEPVSGEEYWPDGCI